MVSLTSVVLSSVTLIVVVVVVSLMSLALVVVGVVVSDGNLFSLVISLGFGDRMVLGVCIWGFDGVIMFSMVSGCVIFVGIDVVEGRAIEVI